MNKRANSQNVVSARFTRREIDWDAVERDYRMGILTVRQIGEAHGLSNGYVCQVAKERGWIRDLGVKIQAQAEAKLAAETARQAMEERQARDREAVSEGVTETVAEVVAGILARQRADIKRMRACCSSMVLELERLPRTCHHANVLARANLLRTLAVTTRELIALERQSFNIDNFNEEPTSLMDPENKVELARRIAFALRLGAEALKDREQHAPNQGR